MRQIIEMTIPRRLGELMQNPYLNKITLSLEQYDIVINVVDNGTNLPNNQGIVVHTNDKGQP